VGIANLATKTPGATTMPAMMTGPGHEWRDPPTPFPQ